MIIKKIKQLTTITVLSSTLFFTNATANESDFVAGVALGAIAGAALGVYDAPRYYDQPYYYYGGRYYYGGIYRDGYYIYHGKRFRSGHYYNHGYRYHNGHRYRPKMGNYGYYRNHDEYKRHHKSQYYRDTRHNESRDRGYIEPKREHREHREHRN